MKKEGGRTQNKLSCLINNRLDQDGIPVLKAKDKGNYDVSFSPAWHRPLGNWFTVWSLRKRFNPQEPSSANLRL